MCDSDDDVPQLPADTLAVLHEFYAEQAEQKAKEGEAEGIPEEDWQLSQFWYSEETATILAKEALHVAGPHGRIACVSCPTMYNKLVELKPDSCLTTLLEFDIRFQKFGSDFVSYDYKEPLMLPEGLGGSYDIVVVDPPFLSEECLTKTAETVKHLTKGKLILCTGAVMEELAGQLLGVSICPYMPQHTRNLANEFRCYSNYETKFLSKPNT